MLWLVLATCITIPLLTSLFCTALLRSANLTLRVLLNCVESVTVFTGGLIDNGLFLLRYPDLHFRECPFQGMGRCKDCADVQWGADPLELLTYSMNIWDAQGLLWWLGRWGWSTRYFGQCWQGLLHKLPVSYLPGRHSPDSVVPALWILGHRCCVPHSSCTSNTPVIVWGGGRGS